ncbi:hypothetical protein L204_104695 [Cryptococcus depauperatus]
MGSKISQFSRSVEWDEPKGGKFKLFSMLYDIYDISSLDPVAVETRIVEHPRFRKVGPTKVMVELKPNGRQEIEFRKDHPWTEKEMGQLNKTLDDLPCRYHWWGIVMVRPHLKRRKPLAKNIVTEKDIIHRLEEEDMLKR